MQIWYEPTTMEVKAVYTHVHNGDFWQSKGYLLYEEPGAPLDRRFMPGAIISIVDDVIDLVTPEPPFVPPPPTDDELRLAELRAKLGRKETLTGDETSELMRIDRGL